MSHNLDSLDIILVMYMSSWFMRKILEQTDFYQRKHFTVCYIALHVILGVCCDFDVKLHHFFLHSGFFCLWIYITSRWEGGMGEGRRWSWNLFHMSCATSLFRAQVVFLPRGQVEMRSSRGPIRMKQEVHNYFWEPQHIYLCLSSVQCSPFNWYWYPVTNSPSRNATTNFPKTCWVSQPFQTSRKHYDGLMSH